MDEEGARGISDDGMYQVLCKSIIIILIMNNDSVITMIRGLNSLKTKFCKIEMP